MGSGALSGALNAVFPVVFPSNVFIGGEVEYERSGRSQPTSNSARTVTKAMAMTGRIASSVAAFGP